MVTLLRSTVVFSFFLVSAVVALTHAYQQLVAIEAATGVFAVTGIDPSARVVVFESDMTDEMVLVGRVCDIRADALTKACGQVKRQVDSIAEQAGAFVPSMALVVTEQLSFVALAAAAVALSLAVTVALAVLIDWLFESVGWRSTALLINRILDTIPYTIWLVLLAGLFGPIVAALAAPDRVAMSLQTRMAILLGQSAIYVGVSMLLMPLFLNFLLETVRAARRNGLFDMIAMDGLTSARAYRRVIFVESRPILWKAMLFGTLFVLLFDPITERISGRSTLLIAGEGRSVFAKQAFKSPFYQWAMLRFDDPDDPLFETPAAKKIEADIEAVAKIGWEDWTPLVTTVVKGPSSTSSILPSAEQVAMEFRVFPALMLDPSRWRTMMKDEAACAVSETCRGVRESGGIGDRLARLAIRSGFAAAYFYFNMALLLLGVGWLATWEFWRNYSRRTEQV